MPSPQRIDLFSHNDFSVPGGGFYGYVDGPPVYSTSAPPPAEAGNIVCATTGSAVRVASLFSSDPGRAWHGFWLRINTATEPNADTVISQIWDASFSNVSKLFWVVASNVIQYWVTSGTAQSISVSLDAWHWVEHIFDTNTNPGTASLIVDGIQGPNATGTVTPGVLHYVELGPAGNTGTVQVGHHIWGSAFGMSDFLGSPARKTSIPVLSAIGF